MTRYYERTLRDSKGTVVLVRVEVDDGDRLEAEIVRLANRARRSRTKAASSAGGVVRVSILATGSSEAIVKEASR